MTKIFLRIVAIFLMTLIEFFIIFVGKKIRGNKTENALWVLWAVNKI
jgi:hypothetical protein